MTMIMTGKEEELRDVVTPSPPEQTPPEQAPEGGEKTLINVDEDKRGQVEKKKQEEEDPEEPSSPVADQDDDDRHDDDMEEIDLNNKNNNTEEEKKKEKKVCCFTRRTMCIAIGILVIIGIAVPIIIIQMIPTLTKNQAIDFLNVSEETQKIFKQLGTAVAVVAAAIGPIIADRMSDPITQADLRTEDIDLGWVRDTSTSTTTTTSMNTPYYGWLPVPPGTLKMQEIFVGDIFSYQLIAEDDTFGEILESSGKFANFLADEKFVPFKDGTKFLFENEDGEAILDDFLNDLNLLPKGAETGYLLPIPPHEWEEQSSDEAISRIFWYGYGAVLIMGPEFREIYDDNVDGGENKKELNPTGFEIDLTAISHSKVRDDFRPYGFKIQFDIDQSVVSIYDPAQDRLLKPGDGQPWEEAKFLVKVTMLTMVTLREHLQWSHLIASNSMTRAMTIHLPPNHPIRRMLSVFTFNTNKVNLDATSALVPERGWVHRMTSFQYDSFIDLVDVGFVSCDIFQPFKDVKVGPGLQKIIDDGRFPYYTEGMAYYQLVHDFVSEWVARSSEVGASSDVYALAFYEELVKSSKGTAYEVPPYSPDNFIDIVSQMIWVVTAYHELVGTIVEYTQLPDFSGARAIFGKTRTDTESYVMALYLVGLTGLRMPKLIADFVNFFGQSGDGDGGIRDIHDDDTSTIPGWEIEVWADFQDALKEQSDIVQAADAARMANGQPEFKMMDPAHFESAISL